MGPIAFRNQAQKRALRPAIYWRRRFVALVVGFGVLSVVAWAFSGVLAVSRAAGSPAAGSPSSAQHDHPLEFVTTSPAAAANSSASPGASANPAHGSRPASGLPAAGRPGDSSRAGAPEPPPNRRACRPGSVVLSLFASQGSYGAGQLPVFDVDVVSTSARRCTFNVGPKFLALVITSGGAKIWSSADCVAGAGSLVTDLVKGVPAVLPISWGRQTSTPGCAAVGSLVPGGTYVAAASHGRLVSEKVAFRIS
ncbi:MAG: hypothetical protein ABSB01_13190 [Streptosporangiaceae bacterium]|jgi:hypothetical protein